jgi:histidine triad (HIT) family protein
MPDCLFCKIVAGEIPSHKVYEDENVLAFLDIFPCAKGHTAVIPKQHYESVWDINTENFMLVAAGLQTAAGKVQSVLKPEGLNIGMNNGKAAGQAVPHLHWHIIPRWLEDGGGSMHSIVRNKNQDADVKTVSELFNH